MALRPLATRLAKELASEYLSFIQLAIENEETALKLPLDGPISLGRSGQADWGKGVDLTPFGAQEKGVSFNHAKLFRLDGLILVVDLDSLNGTLINNYRIPPHSPFILNDGDCLQLGMLQIKVSYSSENR
jgi:predicted component of type VI protein secretion system